MSDLKNLYEELLDKFKYSMKACDRNNYQISLVYLILHPGMLKVWENERLKSFCAIPVKEDHNKTIMLLFLSILFIIIQQIRITI